VALLLPALYIPVRQGCKRACARARSQPQATPPSLRHSAFPALSSARTSSLRLLAAAPVHQAAHTLTTRTLWHSRSRLRDPAPTRALLTRRPLLPATLCHTLPPLLAHTRGRKAPCRRLPLLLSILPSTHPPEPPSPRPRRAPITPPPHSPPTCLPFSPRHACPRPVPHRHRAPNHPVLITSASSHMTPVAT
jgi:hypothetical protein